MSNVLYNSKFVWIRMVRNFELNRPYCRLPSKLNF